MGWELQGKEIQLNEMKEEYGTSNSNKYAEGTARQRRSRSYLEYAAAVHGKKEEPISGSYGRGTTFERSGSFQYALKLNGLILF